MFVHYIVETKKAFKQKRKHHYNEYGNVKLARELIEKELAELEDDGNNTKVSYTCVSLKPLTPC